MIHCLLYDNKVNGSDFNFDDNELNGLVKINANEALELFKNKNGKITEDVIKKSKNSNTIENKEIAFDDFLVNKSDIEIEKYGDILNKVIELTQH